MATANFKTQKHFDLYASEMIYNLLDDDGNETEEYEFDDALYEETKDFIDTLNKQLKYFKIRLQDGYYAGVQTIVDDIDPYYDLIDFLNYPNDYDGKCLHSHFGYNKYILTRMLKREINLINNTLLPQLKDYNFEHLRVVGRFSNGETIYERC